MAVLFRTASVRPCADELTPSDPSDPSDMSDMSDMSD